MVHNSIKSVFTLAGLAPKHMVTYFSDDSKLLATQGLLQTQSVHVLILYCTYIYIYNIYIYIYIQSTDTCFAVHSSSV